MPANLTPDYLAADRKFKEAATPQDKLAALEEMLATIPKHKGTEKMQATSATNSPSSRGWNDHCKRRLAPSTVQCPSEM